jgi:hypothetical protein
MVPLQNKDIPFRLLDSKTVLRALRTKTQAHGLSFSDKEILEEYTQDEIPQDIKNIVADIRDMFQEKKGLEAGSGLRTEAKKAIKSVNKPTSKTKQTKTRKAKKSTKKKKKTKKT